MDTHPQGSPVSTNRFGMEAPEIAELPRILGASTTEFLTRRFQPLRKISEGGLGVIYLVQERVSGRFVALKVMRERVAFQQDWVHQFIREAVITARLEHPNVIPVHELGFVYDGHLYFTMRYVQGRSLAAILASPGRRQDECLRILRDAAKAAQHAHGMNLWHRDVKPENILVGAHGDAYLIDWGLVSVQPGRTYSLKLPKLLLRGEAVSLPVDDLLDRTDQAVTTQSGAIVGTPAYMAPETLAGRKDAGAPADAWAFGVILFEILTGQHPLGDIFNLSKMAQATRIFSASIPAPRDLQPDVDRRLDNVAVRLMERDPDDRAGLETLIQAIDDALAGPEKDWFVDDRELRPREDPLVTRQLDLVSRLQLLSTWQVRERRELESELRTILMLRTPDGEPGRSVTEPQRGAGGGEDLPTTRFTES